MQTHNFGTSRHSADKKGEKCPSLRKHVMCILTILAASAATDAGMTATAQGLKVTHIEVAQVIQDPDNSVKLVARKENTLARVYLEPDDPGFQPGANVTLTIRLRVVNGAGQVFSLTPQSPVTLDPAQQVPLSDMHKSIERTLNFKLAADVTVPGETTLSVEGLADLSTGVPYSCSNCATFSQKVTFVAVPTLRVRVIGFSYTLVEPGSTAITLIQPKEDDYRRIESWLKRTYPVPNVDFSSTTQVVEGPITPDNFACENVLPQVGATRSVELGSNRSRNLRRTHYYGLVSDANGRNFVAGCTPAPRNPDPSVVGAGPTGPPSLKSFSLWKTDGTYGDYYTGHEVAHGFGRLHPGKCPDRGEGGDIDPEPTFSHINEPGGMIVGYDFGDPSLTPALPFKILPGDKYRDVMSYCDFQWVSKHTYEQIMDRIIAEEEIFPDRVSSPPGVSKSRAADIAAPRTARGGMGELRSSYAAGAATTHGLMLLTNAGATVQDRSVSPERGSASRESSPPQEQTQQYDAELLQKMESGDFINIFGTVNLTKRTGKFFAPLLRSREVESRNRAKTERPDSPSMKVQYLNKGGDEIGIYYLPLENALPEEKEGKIFYVRGAVPVIRDIARINLILVGDAEASAAETLLASPPVSDSGPQVKNLVVSRVQGGPGTADPSRLPLDVRWNSDDKDDAEIRYIIELSKDDGNSWDVISPSYSGTSILINPNITAKDGNVREVKVRVTAIEGLNKDSKMFTYKIK